MDQVAFFIDRGGGEGFLSKIPNLLPLPLQILVVALDLRLGALAACCTHDEPGARRQLHAGGDFLELFAVRGVGDLAADPPTAGGVRHKHTVAARQADIGGQCGTFIAAFLFDDLHQNGTADFDHFLDFVFARTWFADRADVFLGIVIGDGVGFFCSLLVIGVSFGVRLCRSGFGVSYRVGFSCGLALGFDAGLFAFRLGCGGVCLGLGRF